MKRRWIGAALVALGLAGQARAQAPYPPMPGGPAPMMRPDFANEPSAVPAPQFCPPGGGPPPGAMPDSPFSLPNDGSPNAFSVEDRGCFPNHGCYLSIGWMALRREGLGNGLVAVLDTASARVDTGIAPAIGSPQALGFNDLLPDLQSGVRATFGVREDCHAFELSGFYIGRQESQFQVDDRGQLSLPFSAFPSPLGFQGDNFLWLQADRVRLNLETSLASGEANYKYAHCPGLEFLWGVRYLSSDERLSIITDDDGLTTPVLNPLLIADYSVRVYNRVLAGQFGFEYEHPIISHITVGLHAKGAWGVNFTDVQTVLRRGDGFFGPSSRRSDTIFSHIYEAGGWATLLITEQCRIRAGYQCLWFVHVPEAVGQVNFDPANPDTLRNNTGSMFYHGPFVELQFKF